MLESELLYIYNSPRHIKPLLCMKGRMAIGMKGRMAIDYIVDFGYRIALDIYFQTS